MNLANYFHSTLSELKQVRWPSWQETLRLTAVVIGISVLVGAYIGGLDYIFARILALVL